MEVPCSAEPILLIPVRQKFRSIHRRGRRCRWIVRVLALALRVAARARAEPTQGHVARFRLGVVYLRIVKCWFGLPNSFGDISVIG
jgi:hypothetical protein